MENSTAIPADATPREQVLELMASAIECAKLYQGNVDYTQEATILLEEIERRAVGIGTGMNGAAIMIFCDPDIPVDFIEGGE